MLISAYDIFHKNIEQPQSAVAELTIVDSGGYETSPTHDLSTVYLDPVDDVQWPLDSVVSVYDKWSDHIPAVFVSHDHYKMRHSLSEQVARARELFAKYPSHLHCLLVKPETKDQKFIQPE
jgi:hypothetical protein